MIILTVFILIHLRHVAIRHLNLASLVPGSDDGNSIQVSTIPNQRMNDHHAMKECLSVFSLKEINVRAFQLTRCSSANFKPISKCAGPSF